jgi:hypothetical protein
LQAKKRQQAVYHSSAGYGVTQAADNKIMRNNKLLQAFLNISIMKLVLAV